MPFRSRRLGWVAPSTCLRQRLSCFRLMQWAVLGRTIAANEVGLAEWVWMHLVALRKYYDNSGKEILWNCKGLGV